MVSVFLLQFTNFKNFTGLIKLDTNFDTERGIASSRQKYIAFIALHGVQNHAKQNVVLETNFHWFIQVSPSSQNYAG